MEKQPSSQELAHFLEHGQPIMPSDKKAKYDTLRKYRHRVSDLPDFTESRYLLDPLIIEKIPVGLVGPPDCGKSLFARQLAVQIALGMPEFLGMKLNLRHHRAVYVSGEDGKDWCSKMFSSQAKGLGSSKQALGRLELISATEMDGGESMLLSTEHSLADAPADLVIVDTFSEAFTGREQNSNAEVRRTIHGYAALAEQYDTVVLFIHHLRKDSYKLSPDQAHVSGAQSFAARLRLVLDLRREEGTESNRLLTVTKGNFIRGSYKNVISRLELNEDTGLYRDTGVRLPLPGETSAQYVNWNKIFTLSTELQTQAIVERLMAEYGMSERTAKMRLNDLVKVKHGLYRRPEANS